MFSLLLATFLLVVTDRRNCRGDGSLSFVLQWRGRPENSTHHVSVHYHYLFLVQHRVVLSAVCTDSFIIGCCSNYCASWTSLISLPNFSCHCIYLVAQFLSSFVLFNLNLLVLSIGRNVKSHLKLLYHGPASYKSVHLLIVDCQGFKAPHNSKSTYSLCFKLPHNC